MATRNRTIVFKKYRDALKSNRSNAPLSTDDPSSSSRVAVTVALPPAWVDTSEAIDANIQRARTKMAELMKAHVKALMPSFGDGKAYQRRIEALTHEITDLFKKSEKLLKNLSSGGPSEDSNIRKSVQRSIATDLQNLSMELRKKQSAYLKRLRQQKESHFPENVCLVNNPQYLSFYDMGPDGVDLEMNINGRSRTDEDEFDDVVSPVVESVNELAQIMKDLSVLVIDQGTIVDRIDYNSQNVAASVEEGFKQLEKVLFFISPHGHVCHNACYDVFCHVGSSNSEDDTVLIHKYNNCLDLAIKKLPYCTACRSFGEPSSMLQI
ncbi:hypothetical protein QQ045_033591 [Rhodiola kirilowii]